MTTPADIVIVTSAHWSGDPRLNRHLDYLRRGGHQVGLTTTSGSRIRAAINALSEIFKTRAQIVILPDPELFLFGSLVARLTGKQPVLDIHEDYPRAVASRVWAPKPLKPLIRMVAAAVVALGRLVAWRVTVAAPELAVRGDVVVLNLPEPEESHVSHTTEVRPTLVYVGDVTLSRGALEMVSLLALLPDRFELLLIGRASDDTRGLLVSTARDLGVYDRLTLVGRVPHEEAWERASGSAAGLCLLQHVPAYRDAVATKIWEYMATGLPPVVSDLPAQRRLVSPIEPGLVCRTAEDAARIITRLAEDGEFRSKVVDRAKTTYERAWEQTRPDLAIQSVFEP